MIPVKTAATNTIPMVSAAVRPAARLLDPSVQADVLTAAATLQGGQSVMLLILDRGKQENAIRPTRSQRSLVRCSFSRGPVSESHRCSPIG